MDSNAAGATDLSLVQTSRRALLNSNSLNTEVLSRESNHIYNYLFLGKTEVTDIFR